MKMVSPRKETLDAPEDRQLLKNPETLRDHKNVVRWRIQNPSLESRPTPDRTKKGHDRPRSAPSSMTVTPAAPVVVPPLEHKMRRTTSTSLSAKARGANAVRKRHWMYLFENLHRSVDEMYKNCEQDFSVEECTNVIHTLEICMEDFRRLVTKIQVLSQYEETSKGKPKSVAVAWDEPTPMRLSPHHTPRTPPRTQASPTREMPWAERLRMSLNVQPVMLDTDSLPASPQSVPSTPMHAQSMPTTPLYSQSTPTAPLDRYSPQHRPVVLQKLSSPERKKRSPEEARMLQDERQAKALKKREEMVSAKKEKAALSYSRVKEANKRHTQLIAKKQLHIDEKHEKAGQLHDAHISQIKRKATTENTKVNEVVWIANQSAETRKFFQKKKLEETAVRRQELAEEKRKKRVEAAAKEGAVAERRKQKMQSVTPNSKSTVAEPKMKVRKMCKYCNVEIASAEYLENHVRGKKHRKAVAEAKTTAGNQTDCIVTVPSDPPPLVVVPINPDEINAIIEQERNQRKVSKGTKQRIAQLALSYIEPGTQPPKESSQKARFVKLVQDLHGLLVKKNFPAMLPILGTVSRTLSNKGGLTDVDLQVFRQVGGLEIVVNICGSQEAHIPSSVFLECLSVLSLACTQVSNRLYMVHTGRLVPLIDLLGRTILTEPYSTFIPPLMALLTLHIWQPADNAEQMKAELTMYIIQTCLFEKMQLQLTHLHHQEVVSLESKSPAAVFVEKTVEFLEAVSASIQTSTKARPVYIPSSPRGEPLVDIFKKTNLVGIISILASLLLQNKPTRGAVAASAACGRPPPLPGTVWSIIFSTIKVLNNVAALDLRFLQNFLGPDEYQIEMFHLFSHFLWYCTTPLTPAPSSTPTSTSTPTGHGHALAHTHTQDEGGSALKQSKLLHEIILLAGYYALENTRAQDLFQWGNSPTILQQLCSLPFQYFSDPRYKTILFPTLIAVCCQNSRNSTILRQEVSTDMLTEYLRAELARKDDAEPNVQVPARFLLKNRMPQSMWEEAIRFFNEREN